MDTRKRGLKMPARSIGAATPAAQLAKWPSTGSVSSLAGSSGSERGSSLPSHRELFDEQALDAKIEALRREQARPPVEDPKLVDPSDLVNLFKRVHNDDVTKQLRSLVKVKLDDVPVREPNETDHLVCSVAESLERVTRLLDSAARLAALEESAPTHRREFARQLQALDFSLPCYLADKPSKIGGGPAK